MEIRYMGSLSPVSADSALLWRCGRMSTVIAAVNAAMGSYAAILGGTARAIRTGMAKQTKIAKMLVAEICLYGNGSAGCGAGWLAIEINGRMLGDGEPVKDRTFTEAVWGAVDALRKVGVVAGMVAIYAPGGERYALAPIGRVPTFGMLQWTAPAPCHVISAAELEAAAVAS